MTVEFKVTCDPALPPDRIAIDVDPNWSVLRTTRQQRRARRAERVVHRATERAGRLDARAGIMVVMRAAAKSMRLIDA